MVSLRAPEIDVPGVEWLNTPAPLGLKALRGRIVILDFWTFCCINCMHIVPTLRRVEETFPEEVVVIGVHSPKFEHEADPDALIAAVERYAVHHPVLDDPELTTWQNYAVKAWPTLVVIDPEGYVVHVAAGEGHVEALRSVITEVVAEHEAKGTLHRGDGPYVPPPAPETTLRFPGKVIALNSGNLLVSDSANHSLVEFEPDGETVVRLEERLGYVHKGIDGLMAGAEIVRNGVSILGPLNLPSTEPLHASQMYARNVQAFLGHILQDGKLRLDFEDQITRDTCVTHAGEVRKS